MACHVVKSGKNVGSETCMGQIYNCNSKGGNGEVTLVKMAKIYIPSLENEPQTAELLELQNPPSPLDLSRGSGGVDRGGVARWAPWTHRPPHFSARLHSSSDGKMIRARQTIPVFCSAQFRSGLSTGLSVIVTQRPLLPVMGYPVLESNERKPGALACRRPSRKGTHVISFCNR